MSKIDEDKLIIKAVKWSSKMAQQVSNAGGDPTHFLRNMPDEVIVNFIRNNLDIKYAGF